MILTAGCYVFGIVPSAYPTGVDAAKNVSRYLDIPSRLLDMAIYGFCWCPMGSQRLHEGDYKTPGAQFLLHIACPSKTDRSSLNEFPACSMIWTFGLCIGRHTTWAYYHGSSLHLTLAPSCTRAWPSSFTHSVSSLLDIFGVLFIKHPRTLMKNNIIASHSHCQITFQIYSTPPLILHSFNRSP